MLQFENEYEPPIESNSYKNNESLNNLEKLEYEQNTTD